jgi:manganese/iron transport system ATP-binding protein/manganese/zinc/iron transport system ATP- binding protein
VSAPAVRAHDLSAAYGAGPPAIEAVSFELEPGNSLCVLGPNGGGKTTLFRVLTGEVPPRGGSAAVHGRPAQLPQAGRPRLDFPVSALDVALMGTLGTGRWWLPPRRAEREAAAAALARVGLEDSAHERFGALSGGQRQRALLARALVQDASVLLLDEPLSAVDPVSAERIEALFGELRAEGRTVVVSTHDVDSARRFDRVLCLNRRQVAFGEPAGTLSRAVLEATYGEEIVVLDEGGRAVTVQHHAHP